MKIIKNSDIKFKLNSKIVYVEDFDMTFYTVNKENFFLKKSSSDVVEEDGYFWLNLAWEDLEYLGRGVMNYDCTNNYNDPEFPDDEYNYFLTKATDYFIDTFEVTPSDGKSINEKIDELQEGLSAETTVRSEADTALSGAIETEISARTSADEVLSGAISGFNTEIAAVRADLDNEVSARTQADEALDQAISNEVSARTEADSALSGAIDSEISARTQAISDEASARTSADEALSGAIDTEVSARTQAVSDEASARTDADATLQSNIDAETSARTAADGVLQTAIDNEVSARTQADTTLQSNIDNETSARTAADEALSGAVDTALLSYFNGAEYVSSAKTINLKHDSTVLATIDATDFIKDGMVENVVISGGNIVITFNTDAGKESISIPLTDIFDPSNYYDKTAVDNAISAATSGKADSTVTDAISGVVSAHTADTDIHVTSGDKATWSGKQDALVAGENITISGNVISAAGAEADDHFDSASTNPVENRVVTDAVIAPQKDYWVSNGSRQSVSRDYSDGIVLKYKVIQYPDDLPIGATLPDNFQINLAIQNSPYGSVVWPTLQVTSFSGKSATVDNDNVDLEWDEDGLIISVDYLYSITRINCYTTGYRILSNSFSYTGGTIVDEAEKIIDEIGNVKKFADKAVKDAYFYANSNGDVVLAVNKFNGDQTESNFSLYLGDGLACKNNKIVSDLNVSLGYSDWTSVEIPTDSDRVSIPKWHNEVRVTIKDWSAQYYAQFDISIGNTGNSMTTFVTLNGNNVDYNNDYFTSVTFENEVLTMVLGEIWGQAMYITHVSTFGLNNKVSALEYYGEITEPIIDYVQDLNSGLTTVSGDVSAHTANTDIHVTSGDKATWNAKVDSEDLTAYTTTAVTDALNTVVTGHTADTTVHVTAQDKSTWSGKQDALVAGENITISGNVISAAGGDLSNYYTKSEVDEMSEVAAQAINELNEDKLDASAYTPTDLSQYYTSAQTVSAITEATSGKANTSDVTTALAAKQDTLVSGTNIKTVNNESLLGSGNITIQGSGGNDVVELTQAEYDALVSGGTVDPDVFYIITDATPADLSQYWTSAQTQSAITQSVSGKQDTLSAGTGIDITSNVISVTGGTGGKTIEAGRGISITTGETADTVSFNLPISSGSGSNSIIGNCISGGSANKASHQGATAFGIGNTASGYASFVIGGSNYSKGDSSFAGGSSSIAGQINSFAFGYAARANGEYSIALGSYFPIAENTAEVAIGKANISRTGSTDADKTLFTVGNGTNQSNRHNAFEIRQNGDIYITSGGTDIKLQDNLGGGGSSVTVVQTTGTSSADVMSQDAVTTALSGKLDSTAYTPTDLSDYYTSAQTESAITAAVSGKADTSAVTAVQDSLSGYTTTGDTNALSGTVTAHTSDSDIHVTTGDKATWNAKVDQGAISDMATQTWVGQQGYLTEHQSLSAYSTTVEMNSAINAATSGKADSADLAGYATTATTSAISGAVDGKQDSLVSSVNIKTINGASILGSGNITVNLNIWSGSAADYAQISPKDPNTLYLVV